MDNTTTQKGSGSTLGASLLIAGAAIGAGSLALPVTTGMGGFFPSIGIYLTCWLFMGLTGLLYTEVCLWHEGETNIVSMAESTLGTLGKAISWGLYLLLFYNLTIAYVAGSGEVLAEVTDDMISSGLGTTLFVAVFAPFVWMGARAVDRINLVLMSGLGVTFILFAVLGMTHIDFTLLERSDFKASLVGLPIVFVSFGYQGLVPTLTNYLNRSHQKLRVAIMVGSFIPLLAYILWQALVLGIVPLEGAHGLAEAFEQGNTAIKPLRYFVESKCLQQAGEFFAFFALVSSFLGVTLGLLDFLADGLGVEKNASGRTLLCLLIFIPPLLASYTSPHVFLFALRYAGGFGAAFLLGLLPIVMVWTGRYHQKREGEFKVPGGRILLILMASFVFTEVALELNRLFG